MLTLTTDFTFDMEKILVVDDEVDICYFLVRNLKKQHFEASYVNSLSDAKNEVNENEPTILLLDNHLPDGLGVDFAHEIKEKYPEIKIVMISAYDTQADRSTAEKNGIDYFLPKPFMINQVFDAIDMVKKQAS